MKYKNGQNIITDSDVTMTGQYLGETLDTVLSEQEENISELKRNVKFLYQYGGVGSHGGSSGGGSSSDYAIYATLNKVQINQDNLISLDGEGNYNLQIMMTGKTGGLEYQITYTYFNKRSSSEGTTVKIKLDISNQYTYSTYIPLDRNGSIRIEAFTILQSGEISAKQISANYITSPYTFDVYLGDAQGNKPNVKDNELFIQTYAQNGLYAYMEYDIGIQSSVSYSYNKLKSNEIIQEDLNLTESSRGIIQIPIVPDGFLIDENAGYYSSTINIFITPLGQNRTKISKTLNFNLIPNSLYLKVSPNIKEGSLYEDTTEENPYSFKIGNISFDLKIYDGKGDSGKTGYKVSTSITNIQSQNVTQFSDIYLDERISYTTKNIETNQHGWNKVTFIVTRNQSSFQTEKYFYVSEVNSDLNWEYFWNKNGQNVRHFGINGSFSTPEFVETFNNDKILIQSESIDQKSLQMASESAREGFTVGETLINIGIQYSSINNINTPILRIKSDSINDNTNDITLYQNKIEIGRTEIQGGEIVGRGINIYLPKEDLLDPYDASKYHLLTFYRKYYGELESGSGFEILVYLDGVLEGALQQITTSSKIFDSIIFYKTGYSINLFDILYFPQTDNNTGFFNDADISRYWYTYNDFKQTERYSQSEILFLKEIGNIVSGFKLNSKSVLDSSVNTKMVEVDNIEYIDIP